MRCKVMGDILGCIRVFGTYLQFAFHLVAIKSLTVCILPYALTPTRATAMQT
jgi:hypothetical protein